MRIHWFQHVPFEDLGCIAPTLLAQGHSLTATRWYAGDAAPAVDAFDALIVMGGPMGVADTDVHPWLVAEKALIRAAIDAGYPVLGICLGAQLIASVLGAEVGSNEAQEIGWFPVSLNEEGRSCDLFCDFPAQFPAFHWHGDRFGIPAGAQLLMTSEACPHQAFLWGERVLGLQFHLEVTAANAREMYAVETPTPGRYIQLPAAAMSALDLFADSNRRMQGLLSRWLS